jgi:hypothetical protein
MAYLGEVPNPVNRGLTRKDTFTGDGSTVTFDLATAIPNVTENDIEVFVNNVRQEPGSGDAYTLGFDGSSNFKRITFTAAPESGSEVYVLSGEAQTQIIAVSNDSITTAKIQDNAVTSAKILDGTITGDDINSTFDISSKTVTLPASVSGLGTGITNDQLAGSIANAKLANSSITINGVSASLGASVTIAAGTDWQAVVVADGSTVTSATAGEGYFINTTSAAHTIQLPSSPSIGDEISIIDYAGTFDTNNLTVDRNGKNIQGSAADLTVSTERAGFTLVFVDDTQGWLLKDK